MKKMKVRGTFVNPGATVEGSGLGLSIVKRVVDLHAGRTGEPRAALGESVWLNKKYLIDEQKKRRGTFVRRGALRFGVTKGT